MDVPAAGGHTDLSMSDWAPGSYRIRDFARLVEGFHAGGRPWRKLDKSTWRIESPGPLHISYTVYGFEPTPRTNLIDSEHALLNGPPTFLRAEGFEREPHRVEFETGWNAVCALPRAGAAWVAQDFESLLDAPFLLGRFRRVRFRSAGRPHEFVVHGPGNFDLDLLARETGRLVREAARLFDGVPYDRYLFLLRTFPGSGGGLEHSNSCVLQTGPLEFRPREKLDRFLGLVAHEYFHAWNVKRIFPAALRPPRYDREAYTRLLWWFEGGTSYFATVLLVRSGVWSPARFYRHLERAIQNDEATPGHRVEALSEASFHAWTHLYQPNERTLNVQSSYYDLGELACLVLDLELRRATGHRASLDTVVRRLWDDYGKKGKGMHEGDLEDVVVDEGGRSFRRFFRHHIEGIRPLPLAQVLSEAGLEIRRRIPKGADLGIRVEKQGEKVVVQNVLAGSPAEEAGLSARDEIVAVDGYRASPETWERIIEEGEPGSRFRLTLFRAGVLREVRVGSRKRNPEITLRPRKALLTSQKAFLSRWLRRSGKELLNP